MKDIVNQKINILFITHPYTPPREGIVGIYFLIQNHLAKLTK